MMGEVNGIVLTWGTVVSVVSGITAVVLLIDKIFGKYNKAYDLVKHQKEQDRKIEALQEEQTIILRGVLACLKGLSEQGCDGPVHEAEKNIENYLLQNRNS